LSKLKSKFLGPYCIVSKSGPNRYDVWKIGQGEGPARTSSGADFMKKWKNDQASDESKENDENPVSEADSV
jgi:hypothetical protein